jgi:hypothetical protein
MIQKAQAKFLAGWISKAKAKGDERLLSKCYQTAAVLDLSHLVPSHFARGSAPGMTGREIVRRVLARGP